MLKGMARVWLNLKSFQMIPTFHSKQVQFHSKSKNQILWNWNRPLLMSVMSLNEHTCNINTVQCNTHKFKVE